MRSALMALAMVLAAGRLACAEEVAGTLPPLRLGNVVRLEMETASAPVEGIVTRIDEDGVRLETNGHGLTLPIESITGAEARVGRRRQWLKGLVIGGGLGLLAGQLWEVDPDPKRCRPNSGAPFCTRGAARANGLIGYGAIGAGIGALRWSDRWAPVDVRAGAEHERALRLRIESDPLPPEAVAPPPEAEAMPPVPMGPSETCASVMAADRVRVTAPGVLGKPLIGYIVGSDATTLKVVSYGQTMSVPRASVTRLERSLRRSKRLLGLQIGGGIGFAAGAAVGIALVAAEESRTGSCDQCGMAIGLLGAMGAIPAGLVGGAVAPGERWVREDPSTVCVERTIGEYRNEARVRVAVLPAAIPGGVGLRLSVKF